MISSPTIRKPALPTISIDPVRSTTARLILDRWAWLRVADKGGGYPKGLQSISEVTCAAGQRQ